MRILVTGTEGYLGSLLAPELIRRGNEVIGLDTGYYKERMLYRNGELTPLTLAKDLRHLEAGDLKGIDAVVHMAELSNDPAGQLAPHITYEINHKGSVRLAQLAKQAGVRRFVYMSSCSVYGVADKDFVDEESSVNRRLLTPNAKHRSNEMCGSCPMDIFRRHLCAMRPLTALPQGCVSTLF